MASGASWSREEISRLIEVWGDDAVQAQLQECTRNQRVFEKISKALCEAGYERTFQQCRDKVKKLRIEYKKVKDKHGKTGENRSDWEHFNAMDAILGNRPATKPPVVIDTSATLNPMEQQEEQLQDDASDNVESLSNSTSAPSVSQSPDVEIVTPPTSKKRKRPSKSENAVMDMFDTLIKAQCKTEERVLDLEEKRLRIEERQLEREAQRRREDREFQLQLMRLLAGQSHHHAIGAPSTSRHINQTSPQFEFYNAYTHPFEDEQ